MRKTESDEEAGKEVRLFWDEVATGTNKVKNGLHFSVHFIVPALIQVDASLRVFGKVFH